MNKPVGSQNNCVFIRLPGNRLRLYTELPSLPDVLPRNVLVTIEETNSSKDRIANDKRCLENDQLKITEAVSKNN